MADSNEPRLFTPVALPDPLPEPEVASVAVRPGKWWIPLATTLAVVYVLYVLRAVLAPFILAFLLAYALHPAVNLLAKLRIPKAIGAFVVFVTFIAGGIFGGLAAFRYFGEEIGEASSQLPSQLETLQRKLGPWLWTHLRIQLPHNWKELYFTYGSSIRAGLPQASSYLSAVLFGTLSYAVLLLSALVVPVFAFYLLVEFDELVRFFGKLVPLRWQRGVFETVGEIDRMVSGYVRGQLLAMVILSAIYASGLNWLGVRLAIPIGILTGCLAFAPYIGSNTGALLAVLMAALDGRGVGYVLQVFAWMLTVQTMDGLFITPRVVGRSVGLSPLEVLLAMAAGGTVFGFVGVVLAVPLGATTKIILRRALRTYRRSDFYRRRLE